VGVLGCAFAIALVMTIRGAAVGGEKTPADAVHGRSEAVSPSAEKENAADVPIGKWDEARCRQELEATRKDLHEKVEGERARLAIEKTRLEESLTQTDVTCKQLDTEIKELQKTIQEKRRALQARLNATSGMKSLDGRQDELDARWHRLLIREADINNQLKLVEALAAGKSRGQTNSVDKSRVP
jgi:chromosome segregation ATPase